MNKAKEKNVDAQADHAAEMAEPTPKTPAAKTEPPAPPPETTNPAQELAELSDRYLRLCAEYDNYRKRSVKEKELSHASAVSYAVSSLLPVYDSLSRAAAAETSDEAYKKGVLMTMAMLEAALKNLGVTTIDAARGTPFDPNLHEALMHVEDSDLGENQISQVFQSGFQLGEKVIRHSIVQVAN